jgi:hypothetical protein
LRKTALTICILSLLAVAAPALAAECTLAMTMACASGACTTTTTNTGANSCTGYYYSFFVAGTLTPGLDINPATGVTFSNFTNSLGLHDECYDSSQIPPSQNTTPFVFCGGRAALAPGASFTASVVINGANAASVPVIAATEVVNDLSTDDTGFAYVVSSANLPTCTPAANVVSATLTGVPYTVSWTKVVDPAANYIVEESTTADFSAITSTSTTSATSAQFQHSVTTTTTFYYRVHAITCSGQPGTNSPAVSIVIQGPPQTNARGTDVVVPFGTSTPFGIPLTISLPSQAGYAFTATTDKPLYYSVSPDAGTVPQNGQLALLITANPATLPPGASTGTLLVTTTAATGTATTLGSTTTSLPVSVTLVTPVTPGGKSLPPPNALVIPVVTHVIGGGNTPFVSDVRMTNAGASAGNFQVTYTPTGKDGTVTGKITNITVAAGQTVALNDIAKNFFGIGATSDPSDTGSGALEIRPTNSVVTAVYASSRTYASTSSGTYGQFIAAIPFSQFATSMSLIPGAPPAGPAPLLSLQQVAQSAKFRTNLGLVEGSGTAATGNINVYKDDGTLVGTAPFTLKPGEQLQQSLGAWISGLPTFEDGRIEIQLTSTTGAVSGYASVLDNTTSDPLAVTPVVASSVHANRYVLPGIAEYVFADGRNFHSDMRIFNGGASDAIVTLTFYGSGAPVSLPSFTLPKGQVQRIDDVLGSFFKLGAGANVGGSIVATTSGDSSLVVTGRTFSNAPSGGTFGQFIPGVTPAQGIGAGDRPLQILQLEESQQFRSNVGLAEVSGNPVDGRLTLFQPDSKVSPVLPFHLDANQFLQYSSLIQRMLPGTTVYNARVMVEVTGGSGRVTAYGSVLDNVSTDPTYVPAQ